jgi:hypothetical protein
MRCIFAPDTLTFRELPHLFSPSLFFQFYYLPDRTAECKKKIPPFNPPFLFAAIVVQPHTKAGVIIDSDERGSFLGFL